MLTHLTKVLLVLLFISCCCCLNEGFIVPNEVKFAANLPTYLALDNSSLTDFTTPFYLALYNINNDPTILPNTTLSYDLLNTGLSPALALKNIFEFNDRELEIVYCCVEKESTRRAAIATSIFQMVQLAFLSSPDSLPSDPNFPLFARSTSRDSYQADAILEILRYLYKQTNIKQYLEVGLICSSDALGLSGTSSFIKKAPEYDVTVKTYQQVIPIVMGGEESMQVGLEVAQLKLSKSRVFVAYLGTLDFKNVFHFSMEQGIVGPDYVWICISECANPYLYMENDTVNQPHFDLFAGLIGVNPPAFKGQKWEELAQQISELDYNQFPVYSPNIIFQYIYDGVYFLATAIHNMIEEGGFTEDGRLVDKEWFINVLLNTTMVGVTGEIELTGDGDRKPSYDIVNLQYGKETFTIVGSWDPKRFIIDKPIIFFGNQTEIPDIDIRPPFAYWSCKDKERQVDLTGKSVDLKTPNNRHPNANIEISYHCDQFIDCENLSDESSDCGSNYIIIYIFFGSITVVLILFAILFLLFTIAFGCIRRRRRFVSASPLFLIVIIFSCIVGYCSIFAWYGKPHHVACAFQPWLLGLPVISMIAALCAKTFRIWRIFKSPFNRKVITDFELLILWGIIMLPAIIILALWTLISTPTANLKHIDGADHYVCDTGGFTGPPGGLVFFFIFVGYSGIVLIFGAFLSIVTRNVPELFNESKLISISIYNLVFLSVVIIPIIIALNTIHPYEVWIIRTCAILYAFSATLWIQFLPKVIALIVIDKCRNTVKATKELGDFYNLNTLTGTALSHIPEANSDQ